MFAATRYRTSISGLYFNLGGVIFFNKNCALNAVSLPFLYFYIFFLYIQCNASNHHGYENLHILLLQSVHDLIILCGLAMAVKTAIEISVWTHLVYLGN